MTPGSLVTKFHNMFLGHFLPREHLSVSVWHSFCSISPKISGPFSSSTVLSVLFPIPTYWNPWIHCLKQWLKIWAKVLKSQTLMQIALHHHTGVPSYSLLLCCFWGKRIFFKADTWIGPTMKSASETWARGKISMNDSTVRYISAPPALIFIIWVIILIFITLIFII